MRIDPDYRRVRYWETEGHGEYQARWPVYEYKCTCGAWHPGGGDVTAVLTDGQEALLCLACAQELEDEGFWDREPDPDEEGRAAAEAMVKEIYTEQGGEG